MSRPHVSRRRALGALASLAVGSAAACSSREPERSAPATSTTTSTSTTSTTLPPLQVSIDRTTIATAAVPLVSVLSDMPPEAVADARATDAHQRLVQLLPAYSTLRGDAVPIPTIDDPVVGRRATEVGWEFDNPTPWNYELTLVVTEDHGDWLRVMFPVRPNGTQGWVRRSDVRVSEVNSHVRINLAERRLVATMNGATIADTSIVVGAERTPTPTGRLYITDYDEKPAGSAYGPWVAALSGYSQALDTFSGGVPVIAIHGTNNPGLVGQARSNGCPRVPNEVIVALRETLPLGTPVDIWP